MIYRFVFSKKAKGQLKKLDRKVSKRIIDKLEYYEKSENPLKYAERLKDKTLGDFRFRIGDYRVIFDINKKGEIIVLFILTVKHRRDVYL